ncbi:hypothetical protein C7M84_006648 [Penaeus vannamei]|uniref:Organic cation transporter protein n=1 Tax=Penaeus vannamei TaxID=6689 RepID=A0A423TEJ7_PENVA|nr:hypothetical protein C7M84_006648 [Penaeus vannamei]
MSNKFDELLTQVGTGKWNLLYFITACYWYILIPPQVLSGVYLTPLVNHTCLPPLLEDPVEISSDSCSYFVNNSSSGEAEEFPCTEWEYDTSVYTNTLTSEFNLVCERSYLRATYQSINMFGTTFTCLASGYIADRFGRKAVVLVTHLTYATLGFCISFASNFSLILALRFIMGCVGLPTIYILALEVCEIKHRSVVGILIGLPWAFGTMAWGGVASQVRDWRWLQRCVILPFALYIPLLFIMDESPRWLIVRGQFDRARRVLQRAARWNKTQLPSEEALNNLITRSLRIINFIFSLNHFHLELVFYGLSSAAPTTAPTLHLHRARRPDGDPWILLKRPSSIASEEVAHHLGIRAQRIAILLLVFIPQ